MVYIPRTIITSSYFLSKTYLYSPQMENRQICNYILADEDEINAIYKKHFFFIPNNVDSESLLQNLFYACLTDDDNRLFANYRNRLLKPQTLKSTIEQTTEVRKLKKCLQKYHKVAISRELGCGKTHFINYCLAEWKELHNFCYVDYNTDIDTTLSKIELHDENGFVCRGATRGDFKSGRYLSSLLIIDHFYNSPDMESELEVLWEFTADVIIIMDAFPPP